VKSLPPVLVTAFLRPEKTIKLVKDLANMGIDRIYISVDGGRSPEEIQTQKLMTNQIEHISKELKLNIEIRHLNANAGLAVAVISALDWFFKNVDFGVILEDDLVPTKEFFEFCLSNKYLIETSSDCWLISGNQFSSLNNYSSSPILSKYPLIWGWATSAEKWATMRFEILNGSSVISSRKFDLIRLGFFRTGLFRARKGQIDSWAVPLSARMFMTGSTCLLPPINLVSNIGNDQASTHSSSSDWAINFPTYSGAHFNYRYGKSNFDFSADSTIEKKIYKIRFRNMFSHVYSYFFDKFRFKRDLPPLSDRLEAFAEGWY
jgi:hypothetical protein